ncbi:olfactory receptor 5P58-like [Pelobates fuscus]|uniref:olfactory receptor 5P58-like n=1 Tax=Pelobates fuscus TaxID=191477 RepID=UPI002FE446C8
MAPDYTQEQFDREVKEVLTVYGPNPSEESVQYVKKIIGEYLQAMAELTTGETPQLLTSEFFLLLIMAYDRYLAICNPLRYSMLMSPMVCIRLVIMTWLLSFSIELAVIISTIQLQFCGPNVIDHFFCDLVPLIELSCSDISFLEVENLILSVLVTITSLISIAVFYVYIIQAALRMSTTSGRSKVFSTCSSHLTVVSIFYGTILGIYMLPNKNKSMSVNKIASLLYTVVTPMINPIIYSLRNKDIEKAVKKLWSK